MVRYTLFRLLIFFGCLLFFWIVGLRNNEVLLLVVSAVVSLVLSTFLLREQRNELSAKIAARVDERAAARRSAVGVDEQAEDAEIGEAGDVTDATPPVDRDDAEPRDR